MRPKPLTGPEDPRHGTTNGYKNFGCRCDACREVATKAHLEYLHRSGRTRPWQEYIDEKHATAEARDNHGTETRYQNLGCRCEACKQAVARARARRRRHASPAVHGATAYRNGCRCAVCRESWRLFSAEYRRQKAAQ